MNTPIFDITNYEGALFDLDGVLIDSETAYTAFWIDAGKRYGIGDEEFAYRIKGTTLKDILATYIPEEVRKALVQEIHDFENTMVYPVFDGVKEFFSLLDSKGIKKALYTSSDDTKMRYLFAQQPWMKNVFGAIVTGSMVSESKPHPQGYLLAAGMLGLKPERCMVFEDSFQGLEAGRRAGCAVIAVATTNSRESLEGRGDVIVDSLKELL